MLPVDIATPRDDWNHPAVVYWLRMGVSVSWLRFWFNLPEKKHDGTEPVRSSRT